MAALFGIGATLVAAVVGFFRLLDAVPEILDLNWIFRPAAKGLNKIWLVLRKGHSKIVPAKLPLSKPRTIYFAKCRLCTERFENPVADVARRLRAEHMQRTHGIYDRETVRDARALPSQLSSR